MRTALPPKANPILSVELANSSTNSLNQIAQHQLEGLCERPDLTTTLAKTRAIKKLDLLMSIQLHLM
jgi:hypothetical protein